MNDMRIEINDKGNPVIHGDYLPQIMMDVCKEREYQNTRWGHDFDSKNTPNDWVTYICRYACEAVAAPWDAQHFRTKMVKAAALCCAAIEWFDRTDGKMPKRHYD